MALVALDLFFSFLLPSVFCLVSCVLCLLSSSFFFVRRDGLGEKVWGVPGEPDAVSWQMLYMGLAGSKFKAARPPYAGGENATGNVYGDSTYDVERPQGGPWPMQDDNFAGQESAQVRYDHAHAFWNRVMGYGAETITVAPFLERYLWLKPSFYQDRRRGTNTGKSGGKRRVFCRPS